MRTLQDEEDPVRDAMRARAQEVAEDLQGTAKNLEDVSTEEERNNSDFCETLDEIVLECDCCGWWCESAEMCTNNFCGDCCADNCDQQEHEEEDDEEDEDDDE